MKYNPALDGLRALAVTAVLAFHCKLPFALGGFAGVDVFFVLSGFLITSLLVGEVDVTGTVSLTHFYFRRALRLYPPLLMLLVAHVSIGQSLIPGVDAWRDAALSGLYLSDYSLAFWHSGVGHTWSLSIEEHFYLIWPLAVLALARLRSETAMGLLLVACLVATVWRCGDYVWHGPEATYYRFDTRAAGLILGSLLAFMGLRPSRLVAEIVGFAGLVLILSRIATPGFASFQSMTVGMFITEIGTAMLIVALSSRTTLVRVFSARPAIDIGVLSYSIYLWSVPIAVILRQHFDPWPTFGLSSALSLGIAVLSFMVVEKPLRVARAKLRAV